MKTPAFRFRFCAALAALLVVTAAPAQAGEIKPLMRDMKQTMQRALNSRTTAEMRGYVARLESDAQQASRQRYRSDQSTYDEGMRTLQRELTEVDRAIAANDLPAAKQALRRINDTKKHYHDLLG